jgi:hypothetical protein
LELAERHKTDRLVFEAVVYVLNDGDESVLGVVFVGVLILSAETSEILESGSRRDVP